jgi:hypothetical protein
MGISEAPANEVPIILMPPLSATNLDTASDAIRTWCLVCYRSRAEAQPFQLCEGNPAQLLSRLTGLCSEPLLCPNFEGMSIEIDADPNSDGERESIAEQCE